MFSLSTLSYYSEVGRILEPKSQGFFANYSEGAHLFVVITVVPWNLSFSLIAMEYWGF